MVINTAIVLAGGSGSRMNSDIPKQYIDINGRPILWYSLKVMEDADFIDEIVLVTRQEDVEFCQKEIVEKYNLKKVAHIVIGGSERYLSVLNGLSAAKGEFVWIHDGARPCVTEDILLRLQADVQKVGATITAVPSKDTVKIVNDGIVVDTPDRADVWLIQTPQVFRKNQLIDAYNNMTKDNNTNITDDAMIMENYSSVKVHITMGEYTNIKVTTPEDIANIKNYLKK
jgi:2-C-methyl-D-erythritol 4-phosphate cytidylyltransferase